MDLDEIYCDASEFYHPNASDNCEKQRICRRNTVKTVLRSKNYERHDARKHFEVGKNIHLLHVIF